MCSHVQAENQPEMPSSSWEIVARVKDKLRTSCTCQTMLCRHLMQIIVQNVHVIPESLHSKQVVRIRIKEAEMWAITLVEQPAYFTFCTHSAVVSISTSGHPKYDKECRLLRKTILNMMLHNASLQIELWAKLHEKSCIAIEMHLTESAAPNPSAATTN